jgi:hypothetical protein
MKRPIVIDVEASGFGRGSYPIEVGVALASKQTHCILVRPAQDWQHWDDGAEALHGITRDALSQYGHEPERVAAQLNEWLTGETVYSDAWGNDSSWISLLFDAVGISQQFKLESLRTLLSEQQVENWHEAKDRIYQKYSFERHRASNDALILQETFCQTC